MTSTRRDFLKKSAATGALVSAPLIWTPDTAFGRNLNSKPTVASIGVGGSRGRYNQGGHIARKASKLGKTIAVCDVDSVHTAEFNKDFGGKLNEYTDYRVLLEKEKPDVVTIGTPDHWHVPIAIAALRAGCDVYCEKPLTLTIQEGIDVRNVVKETGRVFQVGTQQRSENENRFLKAVAIVQSGRLGKNVNAYVAIGGAPSEGPFESTEVPEGLDWDFWVGPAPKADYSEERRKQFRWWFEYSGGKMTDWGAHHIDIAQWALGYDKSGPVEVVGKGTFPPIVPDDFNWDAFLNGDAKLPSGFNTAVTFDIDLKFKNGSVLNVNDVYKRPDTNIEFGNGILFEGENGRIFVNRGKLEGKLIDELSESDHEEINALVAELYKGKTPGNHMQNFFECLEDRQQPISDVSTHHRTMTSCHLCNISVMLGRDLKWDPKAEKFVGDDQAQALTSRRSRDSYLVASGT
ncbi:Gfo/Idh/MocA family oxidoreductase [Symmachiella dynata]|uniref:Gfo/Idh/MocA family protein n=1 Tax=Symmachiella dynata TaxID=2527995 RepID=UPI0030EC2978